jgi:hypothetical protein
VVLIYTGLALLGVIALVTGTGVWISALVQKVTTAVVLTLVACATYWIGLPFFCALFGGAPNPALLFVYAHPFAQIGVVTAEASGGHIPPLAEMNFRFPMTELNTLEVGCLILFVMLFHLGFAYFLCRVGGEVIRGPWEGPLAADPGRTDQ